MGSRGSKEVWLAGQAWEEALECSESLEQYWDKSLGKERKTEVFILEAVAQEHEAEGNVWNFHFFTTRWRDCGGIIMKDYMMLQVCGPVRVCLQIFCSKIFYVLASPQVVWVPTHMWLPLYRLSPLDASL